MEETKTESAGQMQELGKYIIFVFLFLFRETIQLEKQKV